MDPATNRSAYFNYDANGLPTSSPAWAPNKSYQWDVENRMTFDGWNTYTYDPQGKRVKKVTPPAVDGQWPQTEIYFYGVGGKLATIQCHPDENGHGFYCGSPGNNLYFAGKLIRSKGVTVVTDRLGSVRANTSGERMRYAPYGQELTSTADGREKFGTYTRDAQGQDYADQRYYDQMGRFWSPDPAGIANPSDPGSWNRYGYATADPVNGFDPLGLFTIQAGGATWEGQSAGECIQFFASRWGNQGFSYYVGNGSAGIQAINNACMQIPFLGLAVYPPSPGPPARLPIECEAILYYRPVDNPVAEQVNATHSYWEVKKYDPNTDTWVEDDIISGGPKSYRRGTLKHGQGPYLDVWIHNSQSGQDTPGAGKVWFDSGLSASNCTGVSAMMNAAKAWPQDTIPYNAVLGPNSNTAAHNIGSAGGFKPTQPPGAWGW